MGAGRGWTHLCGHVLIHAVGRVLDYMTDETPLALWTHVKDQPVLPPSGYWVHNSSPNNLCALQT